MARRPPVRPSPLNKEAELQQEPGPDPAHQNREEFFGRHSCDVRDHGLCREDGVSGYASCQFHHS
jgi:hypothetical protein